MKLLTASVVFFIIFLSSFTSAQSFPQPQDKYVNDFAGFLDSENISQLRGLLAELERNTTAEVVVVTVQTTEPLTPQQYRTELFNRWKIGKAEKDNGLLILYAVKEKRIEVEVGYGLEGILPDSKVGRILDEFYVPYRDANKTAKGIVLAAQELASIINENAEEVRTGNVSSLTQYTDFFNNLLFSLPLITILFFIMVPAIIFSIPPKCNECGKRMRFYGTKGKYNIYICENGHTQKRKKRRHIVVFAGGFRRSGGSGGFGGFGGGGSGGGGAGR